MTVFVKLAQPFREVKEDGSLGDEVVNLKLNYKRPSQTGPTISTINGSDSAFFTENIDNKNNATDTDSQETIAKIARTWWENNVQKYGFFLNTENPQVGKINAFHGKYQSQLEWAVTDSIK